MLKTDRQKLFLKLGTLAVLVVCLMLLSYRENLAHYMNELKQQATVPVVSVLSQQGAPIRISVLSYDSSDPRTPEIVFELTNTSIKPIRAYAIHQETLRGTEKSGSLILADPVSGGVVLPPGQYITESITYQPLTEVVSKVTLSVDFIEFTDGTTWGPNAHRSAELLSGRRAGVLEAENRLLQVYTSDGLQGVIKLIGVETKEIVSPSGNLPQWEEGFRQGFGFTSRRFKRILEGDGRDKLEIELRRLSGKPTGGK